MSKETTTPSPDISDAERDALLKLIQERNIAVRAAIRVLEYGTRTKGDVKELEDRCDADWTLFYRGVTEVLAGSRGGLGGSLIRHLAAWAIVRKPFELACAQASLPCAEWAETRAMAKHLQSKLGANGSGESAIKNEVLLVRYFYAYAGRSQPDDASLDVADLRTVLEEVVELLAFEERLDYCKLVSRETARYEDDNYLYFNHLKALRRTMTKRITDAVWYGGGQRIWFYVKYLRAIVIQPYYEYQMAQMSKRDSAGKS